MAMVNPMINHMQVKDSRWLTLEVCREFTRNKCTRTETECKFAHPPPHVEVQNGRVTCCFDSIKGKCQRKDPPCKYLHPPQHLREQLLQNGKNNLILKNLQMQAMAAGLVPMGSPMGAPVGVISTPQAAPYMTMQNPANFGQYISPGQFQLQPAAATPGQLTTLHGLDANTAAQLTSASMNNQHMAGIPAMQQSQGVSPQTKAPRPDRLEGMSAVPGMMPMVKRQAIADNKSGIPMYQPSAGTTAYQQAALAAMSLQQQPFVPVTSHQYTVTGHPPSVPRF